MNLQISKIIIIDRKQRSLQSNNKNYFHHRDFFKRPKNKWETSNILFWTPYLKINLNVPVLTNKMSNFTGLVVLNVN